MVHQSQFIEMFDRCSESFKKYPISDLCHSSNDIKCGPFGTQLKQAEYTDQGIPVWGIPQINSGFTLAPDVFVSEEKARQLEHFSLVSEDIAMSRKGNVGQCALYPDFFEDGIIASDVVRIRVNKEMILPHFLVYQLHNSHQIRKQILEVSDGTVMAGINVTKMKGIIVYCPPISSQQKFKTILEQADKSKFDGFKSQFIEMFGTISGNTPLSLGDFFSMKAGKSITAEDIKLDQEEDLYPCYGGNGVRGYVTSYTHEGDTVLIGRQGALCGNVQIARNKFYATEHAVVVTPKTPVNISWLYYALKSMELNQYARGVAQPGLAVGQLEKLPFVLPSMKSQNEFARVSHQADKSKYLN